MNDMKDLNEAVAQLGLAKVEEQKKQIIDLNAEVNRLGEQVLRAAERIAALEAERDTWKRRAIDAGWKE